MAVLLSNPVSTALDADANVKSGATRTFYLTGTTTAADVYEDADENTPHAQPIEALANGRWPAIYVPEGTALKMVQDNGGGDSITVDPVNAVFSTDTINFQQEGSGAGIRTSKSKLQENLSVEDYYSGTSDDRTAAMRVFDRIIARGGGTAHFTADSYLFTSQVTLDCSGLDGPVHLDGHGARLLTTGNISALQIINHNDLGGRATDFRVDHRGNGDALAGYSQQHTVRWRWECCHVIGDDDVDSGYGAWLLEQSDPNDSNTANFWTKFPGCNIRSTSGIQIPNGVILDGAQNDTDFNGMCFSGIVNGILMRKATGTTEAVLNQQRFANSVRLRGASFEGLTNVVKYDGVSGNVAPYSLVIDSRLESIDTVLKIVGADVNNAQPAHIVLDQTTQDVTTIVDAPDYVRVHVEDYRTGGFGEETHRYAEAPIRIMDASGDGNAKLIMQQNAVGKSLRFDFDNNTGTVLELGSIGYTASGVLELKSNYAGFVNLFLGGLHGISASDVRARNFSAGKALVAGSGAVTFAVAEADSNYDVYFSADEAESFKVTSRSTSGFTITSSNGSSTANVRWLLVHR